MRILGLSFWMVVAVLIFVVGFSLGGCAGSKLQALADDQAEKTAAVGVNGTAVAADLQKLEGLIASTPPKPGGEPDFATIIGAFNRDPSITTETRLAISSLAAAGNSPEKIVRSLQGQLAESGRALLAEFEKGQLELAKLTREAEKAAAQDEAWWGIGELGFGLLATLVPGAAIGANYFGRIKGIVRGRTEGATLAAKHVATARSLDPKINEAFATTSADAVLRTLMASMPPEVQTAIRDHKTAKTL